MRFFRRSLAATLMMVASLFKILTVIAAPQEDKEEFRDAI
jgi:hypothetical protein